MAPLMAAAKSWLVSNDPIKPAPHVEDELVRRGNTLFRWRSFLPLVLVPPALWMGWEAPDWAHARVWQVGCWGVGLLGLWVRAKTIGHVPPGTSGRNTSEGQVAESLNTRGMYSLVRHPLYLGNYLMWMGLVLATGRMDFALVVTLLYMMYYLRIAMAEEAFLDQIRGSLRRVVSARAGLRARPVGLAQKCMDAGRQRHLLAARAQAGVQRHLRLGLGLLCVGRGAFSRSG